MVVKPGEATMQDLLYDLVLRELVDDDDSLRDHDALSERIREAEKAQPAGAEALDEGGEA
jgi:hypothetical protein